MHDTINDRYPNFRSSDGGKLYLVRCFACDPDNGTENWLPAVASGACAHCGWAEEITVERQRVAIELDHGAQMHTCLPAGISPESLAAVTAVGRAAAQLLDDQV